MSPSPAITPPQPDGTADSSGPTPSPSTCRGRGRGRGASTADDEETDAVGPTPSDVPEGGPIVNFDVYVKDTYQAKDKNPVSLTIQAPNAEALCTFVEQEILNPDRDWIQGFAQYQNGQWCLTDRPPVAEGNPNLSHYVSIFNRSARHTFKEVSKSSPFSLWLRFFFECAHTDDVMSSQSTAVITNAIHANWHNKRLRMCVYKWGSNIGSAKDLAAFTKACIDHSDLNPAGAPVENTVQDVALRLKQARADVYTGPTAAFRQRAAILLKEPASMLDQLIEESDPPPNVRTRLTAVPSPESAATTRSIQLAKVTMTTMKKEHDDLRQFALKLVEGTRDLHAQAVALLARIQAGEGQLVSADAMLTAIQTPLRPSEVDRALVSSTPDAADTCHGAAPMPRTTAARNATPAVTPTPIAEDDDNDGENDGDGWNDEQEDNGVDDDVDGEQGLDPSLQGIIAGAD